ncbi:expressed unknown protein [Seminavis robusta]|uniref:Stc1 domain-containing protein n=1 Tax=Seminavis robusta TaxID=568900 RepID=A0A9N8DNT4_9STRA|nr:expressed unknown protein [Seminavis robusta]|eukprot:Sro251_g099240.1 n/a (462) ;mRNA; r:29841-31226
MNQTNNKRLLTGVVPSTDDRRKTKVAKTELECASCKLLKPPSEFSKNQKTKGSLARCKECITKVTGFTAESQNAQKKNKSNGAKVQKKVPENKEVVAAESREVVAAENKEVVAKPAPAPAPRILSPEELQELQERLKTAPYFTRSVLDGVCNPKVQKEEDNTPNRNNDTVDDDNEDEDDWEEEEGDIHSDDEGCTPQSFMESLPQQRKMPTFQYPLETDDDEIRYDSDDEEIEQPDRPSLEYELIASKETLVGTHDLIFFFTQTSLQGRDLNQAILGTVEFTKQDDSVLGKVMIDKSIKWDLEWHWPDWELRMTGDSTFEITNIDHPLQCPHTQNEEDLEFNGNVYTVNTPIVLPYAKSEFWELKSHQLAYNNSVPIDTEAAQKVIDEYESGKALRLKWLSKIPGINLPEKAEQLISQFASSKPPPALILQKGDIVLNFPWDEDNFGGYVEYLVARPRSPP